MTAYYNEIDLYCAEWMRNLMDAGHIAPGVIDTRSIEDVTPADLAGFTQCHFFAGIGVWSLALRAAGWPDSRPAWTGSCPCQPFSAAGKGAGFSDERHLWPAWQHLIAQCRPAVVFGEQVASKAVDAWIDLVHADMEGMGYAFGGIAFPSAGVGAPHIRDRTFWVADSNNSGRAERRERTRTTLQGERPKRSGESPGPGATRVIPRGSEGLGARVGGLGHANSARLEGHAGDGGAAGREGSGRSVAEAGVSGGMANANGGNASAEREQRSGEQRQQPQDGSAVRVADATISGRREERADGGRISAGDSAQGIAAGLEHGGKCSRMADAERERRERPGPTNGFWRAADWLGCTDGKWRPVEPGTFPLVAGIGSRVGRVRADQERLAALLPRKDQGSRQGRLRGYGNAINAQAAQAFIESYCEARGVIDLPKVTVAIA